MKNKYFTDAESKLQTEYKIDILEDVLLARQDIIILYAERSNIDDIKLQVISGNLNIIGFDDEPTIKLSEILNAFDYNNKYGEVTGKQDYFEETYRGIHDFSEPKDISFPIINKGGRKWLRFNIFPSPKISNMSIFTIMDVTRLHSQEEETFAKTHVDSLTGLFNKYTFDYHYGRMYQLPGFHVMYLDLDNFKDINDTYGHNVGNDCLKAVAKLLKSFEPLKCLFYRVGGDEFVGLLTGETAQVKEIAETIIKKIREIKFPEFGINLTASMGVIKANKSVDLARKADDLMYQVKKTGKNNYLYGVEENE
jgi:diguanylate cyclase